MSTPKHVLIALLAVAALTYGHSPVPLPGHPSPNGSILCVIFKPLGIPCS